MLNPQGSKLDVRDPLAKNDEEFMTQFSERCKLVSVFRKRVASGHNGYSGAVLKSLHALTAESCNKSSSSYLLCQNGNPPKGTSGPNAWDAREGSPP